MTHSINQRYRIRTTLAAVLLAAAAIFATTFGVRPAEAAFPGENGKIVFEGLDLSTGNYEIYAVNPDGSNPTRLTDNPAEDRGPALSPDGKKIAFTSNRDGKNAIYVMGVDGSSPTRLTNDPETEDSAPSWSPDGEKVVFQSTIIRENNPEIYVVDDDGSNPTRLTESPSFDLSPVFSPDGSKIAFMSNHDGDSEVFVMGSGGSDPTNLTDNTVYDAVPNWSPDGSRIAFLSERDGDNEVFVMGPDGSSPTNLTNNGSSEYDPAFSPAGDKIVFSSDQDGDAEIYAMNATDGSDPTRVTDSPTINFDPDWQPLLDTVPPTVSAATPTGKAVSRNASLKATFSEEMDRATITKKSFKLFKVNPDKTITQVADVAVSISPDGTKAKLDPFGASTTLLRANTKYKGVITIRAKDSAGNPLARNLVWTFTTGSR